MEDNSSSCPNGYTSQEVFLESFSGSDDEMRKCNGCPHLTYDPEYGTTTCDKFNK